MTKHAHHEHCSHEEVAYCSHCSVVYCKGCKREWSDCKLSHYYPWYTYTTTTADNTPVTSSHSHA